MTRTDAELSMRSSGTERLPHADFVVSDTVVVELKAGAFVPPGSREQLLNYLRLSGLTVGLLLFFGPVPEFQRIVKSARPRR